MTIPVSELQNIAPTAIIELYQLHLVTALHGSNEIYYFHSGANLNANGRVRFAGVNYERFPIECEGFEYSGQGQLPRPRLRASNVLGMITAILLAVNEATEGNDLTGAKLIRLRTCARYLDAQNFPGNVNPYGPVDPTYPELPREIYYVDRKTTENRQIVEFELAAAFDLAGVKAPKRQCISNVCQWEYRSTECSYAGTNYFDENDTPVGTLAADVCGKRLSSCKARFGQNNELPFGSFPGIGTFNV